MRIINKLLIANRGEIAARIIRTASKLGIRTVAIYSQADFRSMHVSMADESYSLGDGSLGDTYLNAGRIIEIAVYSGCDAVHPGYGFLAENESFAEGLEAAGIRFVGPRAEAIRIMGNKIAARDFALKAGVPVTPGATGKPGELLSQSRGMKFPLLIKAAAGGGGKGMSIVNNEEELKNALESTSREALNYFGDGTVYLEKYIEKPRHIEVQLLGDLNGNVIHLFERECSIQRRYQKIIEESPSPTLTPEVRKNICEAAMRLGKAVSYNNAGTIEFLVDEELNFYFLEMNTRIQVEHPVTEMVTGIDIVEEQLFIASGRPLRIKQEEVIQKGHAIECRIYAEDPAHHFLPSPGEIFLYHEPAGAAIRIDSSISGPALVRSFYDPMIAKLISHGETRENARHRMLNALNDYIILGIKTNIAFLSEVLKRADFVTNNISTHFCDDHSSDLLSNIALEKEKIQAPGIVIPFALYSLCSLNRKETENIWTKIGWWRLYKGIKVSIDGKDYELRLNSIKFPHFLIEMDGIDYDSEILSHGMEQMRFRINGALETAYLATSHKGHTWLSYRGLIFDCERNDILVHQEVLSLAELGGTDNRLISPMPGRVIKVNVEKGDEVIKGQVLLVVEAMKMENNILAPEDGRITDVSVKTGDMIDTSLELVKLEQE